MVAAAYKIRDWMDARPQHAPAFPGPRLVRDRRLFQRVAKPVTAEARRLDNTLMARRQPRLTMNVRDVSVNGMSAVCEQPVIMGEHLSVVIAGEQGSRGWGAFGRVVRCEAGELGYRVAVEFDPLPAA